MLSAEGIGATPALVVTLRSIDQLVAVGGPALGKLLWPLLLLLAMPPWRPWSWLVATPEAETAVLVRWTPLAALPTLPAATATAAAAADSAPAALPDGRRDSCWLPPVEGRDAGCAPGAAPACGVPGRLPRCPPVAAHSPRRLPAAPTTTPGLFGRLPSRLIGCTPFQGLAGLGVFRPEGTGSHSTTPAADTPEKKQVPASANRALSPVLLTHTPPMPSPAPLQAASDTSCRLLGWRMRPGLLPHVGDETPPSAQVTPEPWLGLRLGLRLPVWKWAFAGRTTTSMPSSPAGKRSPCGGHAPNSMHPPSALQNATCGGPRQGLQPQVPTRRMRHASSRCSARNRRVSCAAVALTHNDMDDTDDTDATDDNIMIIIIRMSRAQTPALCSGCVRCVQRAKRHACGMFADAYLGSSDVLQACRPLAGPAVDCCCAWRTAHEASNVLLEGAGWWLLVEAWRPIYCRTAPKPAICVQCAGGTAGLLGVDTRLRLPHMQMVRSLAAVVPGLCSAAATLSVPATVPRSWRIPEPCSASAGQQKHAPRCS